MSRVRSMLAVCLVPAATSVLTLGWIIGHAVPNADPPAPQPVVPQPALPQVIVPGGVSPPSMVSASVANRPALPNVVTIIDTPAFIGPVPAITPARRQPALVYHAPRPYRAPFIAPHPAPAATAHMAHPGGGFIRR